MSDFDFEMGSGSDRMRTFQVGFGAEVETVKGWTTNGTPSVPPVFTLIPSGPVLITLIKRSLYGSTIKIAESKRPASVAQWVVENGNYSQEGLSVRTITVLAGADYTAFHNLKGPFVAIFVDTDADDFVVQALGIPERAPASMLPDPNPPHIQRGV